MHHLAERNLKLYPIARIFTKRVYLPLMAIYFVSVSGVSLTELGVLAAFLGAVKLVIEIPTGYFSDKVSRRGSYLIAAVCGIIAMTVLITVQSKFGVFLGMFIETIGYAFFSGSGEALVHDSLSALNREDEYTKFKSRAQSVSLLANAVIIALVPLTYSIDVRLPFVFGIVQFVLMFLVSYFFTDISHLKKHDVMPAINVSWLKSNKAFISFALIFGLFAALYTSFSDFNTIAFEEYGLDPSTLGLYFSITSLAGAVLGFFVHHLKKLRLSTYALIDIAIAFFGLIGLSFGSPVLAIIAMVVNFSFWRYRAIIYQEFVLKKFTTNHKATLLSTLYNAEQLHAVWLPIVFGALVGAYGLQTSFLIAALFALLIAVPFCIGTVRTLEPRN